MKRRFRRLPWQQKRNQNHPRHLICMTNASPVFSEDTNTVERELARLDHLARMLDSRFRLPGTSIRFGLDSLVGLVPGIGDTLVAAPSIWMIWRGHVMGIGKVSLARMAANVGIDYVIGAIPLLGDLFDVGFKANLRNMEILRKAVDASDAYQLNRRCTTG